MNWMFILGFIAGAASFDMFICWMGKRIRRKKTMDAFKRQEEKTHD